MEIERKYLISSNLSAETFGGNLQCYDIEQYYVRLGDIEERYRKKANKFFHTIKKRTDNSLKREEIESECSYLDFETNKQNIIGNLIKKQRYIYVWKNYNLEIDIYKGPLMKNKKWRKTYENKNKSKSRLIARDGICGNRIDHECTVH